MSSTTRYSYKVIVKDEWNVVEGSSGERGFLDDYEINLAEGEEVVSFQVLKGREDEDGNRQYTFLFLVKKPLTSPTR